jgi:transposase InsO family protein
MLTGATVPSTKILAIGRLTPKATTAGVAHVLPRWSQARSISPRSNGIAEAFVRTIKRDYVCISPRPNGEAVFRQLPAWIAHYNEVHPHKALGYRSPSEFIATYERP